MPIKSFQLPADVKRKVKRKISELLKKKILHFLPDDSKIYEPGFCMAVQIVPKRQVNSMKFGKPEGFRVFIQHASSVLAAVDFVYNNDRLTSTAIHQGRGLQSILAALNKLEKKYEKIRGEYHIELIYFLLAPGTFFKVSSGRQVTYFQYKERLTTTSAAQLQKLIMTIINHHQNN